MTKIYRREGQGGMFVILMKHEKMNVILMLKQFIMEYVMGYLDNRYCMTNQFRYKITACVVPRLYQVQVAAIRGIPLVLGISHSRLVHFLRTFTIPTTACFQWELLKNNQ